MIPLALVTGFLGSGKTTLLRHVIARNSGRRLAFIVNEFEAADVDGRLLEIPDDQLVCIPGGSIFCRCLAGEFIRHLHNIADQFDAPSDSLDGVVIEASGIADPKVAGEMLRETGLDKAYQLRSIITVVDPGSFGKLLATLPNITAQIEACNLAVVNKTDLYSLQEIDDVEADITRINPLATIVRTRFARIDVDVFDPAARQDVKGQYAACADPHYATSTVGLAQPIDVDRLLVELESLRDELYRAKGFVPTTDGTVHVDLSASGLTCRAVSHPSGPCQLVLIARADGKKRTDELIAKLKSGALAVL